MDLIDEQVDLATARTVIQHYTSRAIGHGVPRDWANQKLWEMGVDQVFSRTTSEYRINIDITGKYGRRIKAASRVEALSRFNAELARVLEQGKITADGSYDNVYRVAVADGAEPVFYAGPEDPNYTVNLDVPTTRADLNAAVVAMLKEGVASRNWSRQYADQLLSELGLPALPASRTYTVEVPVTGTTTLTVKAYEDEGEAGALEAANRFLADAAAGKLGAKPGVLVVPEETGAMVVHEPQPALVGTVLDLSDAPGDPDEDDDY